MRIAVISDIHSNAGALKAVLSDIDRQQVDTVLCAGDLVGYGPFPDETIELIRRRQIPAVMGNYDDAIGHMRFVCGCDYRDEKAQALGEASIAWTKQHTSEENKEFLRGLPAEIRLNAGDARVLLVHGSPNRLNEYIFEETPVEQLRDYLDQGKTDILVCGHTHKPFHALVGDRHIINAGSVGKPKHGDPRATYVILSWGSPVTVEIRKVYYDHEAAARAVVERGLPPEFADMLCSGRG